jgi:neutral amino acid transport system permease protein
MLSKNERGDPAPSTQESCVRRTIQVLISAVITALIILSPTSAGAAETQTPSPDPTPSPGATATPPDGAFISVTLIDSSKQDSEGEAEPIPGVRLNVSTTDGEKIGDGVTDVDGRAFIEIPGRGSYVVELDTTTLPAGVKLSGGTETKRTVNALLDGANFAQFQVGVADVETVPFEERLLAAVVSGVKFGLIVALAALGLNLIFGTTKLTNFSHGELITFGAIATYVANRGFGLPVIAAGGAAVVASALFGWAQDRGLWKPLRRRGVGIIAMMIVSIGFGLLLRSIFQYTFGGSTRSLSQYVSQGRDDYGPFALAPKEIGIIVVALVVITVVCIAMAKTRLGKAMRAVADNPALSASSGLRVDGVISSVWVLGTALTGLSGALFAVNSQVSFLMGFKLLLLVFAAVTLGGLGTIWGALVGSMIIGVMVETGPIFGVPSSIKEVGALVVLILILLIRPQGILGRRERIG